MNAKVQISLSKQIPLYRTINMVDAYSLAFNTTTQTQVLISCISKETIRLKSLEQENSAVPHSFTVLESLISIAEDLAANYCNIFDVEHDKYKNGLNNSNIQYDAGDLLEPYGLAHEVSTWLSTLIFQMKDELITVKKSSTALCDAVFTGLENLINIADYLSDNHRNTFKIELEKYEAEWEASKNG